MLRNLEVIGEAVKRLSPATLATAPTIPWKQIAGMRDVLIHHYFGVNLELVWEVIARDLAPLQAEVDRLLGASRTDTAGEADSKAP